MKKFADPFESFTAANTPDDFAVCAWMAAEWLLPYMKHNDPNHVKFIVYCLTYSDLILNNARGLDDLVTAAEANEIIELQRKTYETFQRVWNATVAGELTTMALRFSKSQSKRASKPRKFDSTEQYDRIAKRYWEAKIQGTGYGFTKALAAEFGVTEQAIRNIANPRKPRSIAK
jgi:hypothetical protein